MTQLEAKHIDWMSTAYTENETTVSLPYPVPLILLPLIPLPFLPLYNAIYNTLALTRLNFLPYSTPHFTIDKSSERTNGH